MDALRHPLQPESLAAQPQDQPADAPRLALELIGGHYLMTAVAARHYGYRSLQGFVAFFEGHGVIPIKRGRRLLWDVRDCDRVLHALQSAPRVQ